MKLTQYMLLVVVLTVGYTQATYPAEGHVLESIQNKFQPVFEKERKAGNDKYHKNQYAVMYWGKPSDVRKIDFDKCRQNSKIFWDNPELNNFSPSKNCPFAAALVRRNDNQHHSEDSIIRSFGNKCPKLNGKKGNIYLYTYHSPCFEREKDKPSCTEIIKDFADRCKEDFNKLYIGFKYVHREPETENAVKKRFENNKNVKVIMIRKSETEIFKQLEKETKNLLNRICNEQISNQWKLNKLIKKMLNCQNMKMLYLFFFENNDFSTIQ